MSDPNESRDGQEATGQHAPQIEEQDLLTEMALELTEVDKELKEAMMRVINERRKRNNWDAIKAASEHLATVDLLKQRMEKAFKDLQKTIAGDIASEKQPQHQNKKFKSFPPNLPKFISKGVAKDEDLPCNFLKRTERMHRNHGIEEYRWILSLSEQCNDMTDADWIEANIVRPKLSWEMAKQVFLGHFVSPDMASRHTDAFEKIMPEKNETLRHFVDRYVDAMRLAGLDPNEPNQRVRHLINRLPASVYRTIENNLYIARSQFDTVDKLSTYIMTTVPRSLKCEPADIIERLDAPTGIKKGNDKSKLKCSVHGWCAHSDDECLSQHPDMKQASNTGKGKARVPTSPKPNAEIKVTPDGEPIPKGMSYCSQHGITRHDDEGCWTKHPELHPSYRKGDANTVRRTFTIKKNGTSQASPSPFVVKPQHHMGSANNQPTQTSHGGSDELPPLSIDTLEQYQDLFSSIDEITVSHFGHIGNSHEPSPNQPENHATSHEPILTDLRVNGDLLLCSIDSGAENSHITHSYWDSADQTVRDTFQKGSETHLIELAVKDTYAPQPGSISLKVQRPHQDVESGIQHRFFLHQMPRSLETRGVKVILGRDLMSKLGISISGLPSPLDDTDHKEESPPEETKPPLVDTSGPPHPLADHPRFKEALARNQAIPKDSFCELPEAVVKLDTGDAPATFVRQYPVAHNLQPVVDEQIDKWSKNGKIRPLKPHETAGYNNPLIVSMKRDYDTGEKKPKRVCIDPRRLNATLINVAQFVLPLIFEIFAFLAGMSIFSTIDLEQSFLQLPIYEKHQEKTAFTWRGNRWCFVGTPFGLPPTSAVLQRVMSVVFRGSKCAKPFQDDTPVGSHSPEEHLDDLVDTIDRLTKAKLRINVSKSHFFRPSLHLLGHTVSADGVGIDQRKIQEVMNWPTPTTGSMIYAFLGLTNFFRDFIPNYAMLAAPLEALRPLKRIPLQRWTQSCMDSFTSLKQILAEGTFLSFPDFKKTFRVATDASKTGLGAVLYQLKYDSKADVASNRCWILFSARSLHRSERNYSATKRECLAIVFALLKFHYFLYGTRFLLFTDHRALVYLFTQKGENAMMNNWFDVLLAHSFEIIHRPGILNLLPDRLSRLFPSFLTDQDSRKQHLVELQHWWDESESQNKKTRSLHSIETEPNIDSRQPTSAKDLEILVREVTGAIAPYPKEQRQEAIVEEHAKGHFGVTAVLRGLLSSGKHWPGMRSDITKTLKDCNNCQKWTVTKKGYHPLTPVIAHAPMDTVATDTSLSFTTSHDGMNVLLILIDVFTRFVFLQALPDKSAASVATALFVIFCNFGFPKVIISDNGSEYVNQLMALMVDKCGIDHRLSTKYHPRGNGLSERTVGTSTRCIKKILLGEEDKWSDAVPATQLFMNQKIAAAHHSAPFSVMFCRRANDFKDYTGIDPSNAKPLTFSEIKERLSFAQDVIFPALRDRHSAYAAQAIKQYAKHHRMLRSDAFPVGSSVMVQDPTRSRKGQPFYEGPFKVLRRNRGGAYELLDTDHTLYQRKVTASMLKLISTDAKNLPVSYVVDKILSHRGSASRREYLVRWQSMPKSEDSWEPASNFDDLTCISNYWKTQSSTPQSRLGGSNVVTRSRSRRN